MNGKEVGCVSQEVGKREKENAGKGILRDFFFLSILFSYFISFCPRHYFFVCLFFCL